MRVAVDWDNVMQEFQPYWAELYKNWFGREVPAEDLNRWTGLVDGTHFAHGDEFFVWAERSGLWETMPWIHGSRGAIDTLLGHGHSVVFVTARHTYEAQQAVKKLVERTWPRRMVPVVFTEDKWQVPAGLYVDDGPAVLRTLLERGKRTCKFSHPWNKPIKASHTAATWEGVLEVVERLEGVK
jgi:glutaredoxin